MGRWEFDIETIRPHQLWRIQPPPFCVPHGVLPGQHPWMPRDYFAPDANEAGWCLLSVEVWASTVGLQGSVAVGSPPSDPSADGVGTRRAPAWEFSLYLHFSSYYSAEGGWRVAFYHPRTPTVFDWDGPAFQSDMPVPLDTVFAALDDGTAAAPEALRELWEHLFDRLAQHWGAVPAAGQVWVGADGTRHEAGGEEL